MPHLTTRMPTGDSVTQRSGEQPAFSQEHNLLGQVLEGSNLRQAWKRVQANKGAAGVDGLTLEAFPNWLKTHWSRIAAELAAGQYQPAPVRRVAIAKPDGGTRPLGIPTVLDRVIQQAIAQVLGPLFDPAFSEHSFGFRPGRDAHQAVKQVQGFIQQGRKIAVDVDLSRFFDCVDHDLLMTHVGYKVQDKSLLTLIGRYLRAGVMENACFHESRQGVPQGGPLSPLLANIMLVRSRMQGVVGAGG